MFKKLMLSEKDYEYLTKGIAFGVGIGVIVGIIFNDINFFFALGGVIGIVIASIYSLIKKVRESI
ncbi:hypothetical protein [Clostridium sp. D53t1_180928_C8]|uniref:hypothetical protein n=1 Tax=Clostridium sp. D53t1_180928_C8 TaxID=2787101 RepID=UPI0018A8EBEA|nr:hypothetical protein [Clostridium sp. D53t1_180928_C8]